MLKLYTYQSCPYCAKVRQAFAELGIKYQEIDAQRGTPGSTELVKLGGKQQVPFLVDEDAGILMYESDDIIAYARARTQKN
jgi:glutathione S-transferase